MVHDFIFGDERASAHGIILKTVPNISGGVERGEWVKIKGMSGSRWRADGSLDDVTVKMDVYIEPWADINDVLGFLTGSGRLTIEPFPWFWEARVSKMPELKGWLWDEDGYEGSVTFKCRPHRYMFPEGSDMIYSTNGSIHNPCNAEAEPVLTVTGSGDGVIVIGDWTINITGQTQTIVLDCESKIAYFAGTQTSAAGLISTSGDGTGNAGSWVRLLPGANSISIGGGVDTVRVTPRWRWK